MASSALSAAVIHDYVTRPRSLEFIAGSLMPLLCPGVDRGHLLWSPYDQMMVVEEAAASSDDCERHSLSVSFPEIVTSATGEATDDDTAPHGHRRSQRAAVARVTALLERVLEALQLYHGAPAETDSIVPRTDGEEDREADRRVRWERNESLVRLKSELTGWLKASKARIPRITRNLSFSTLSESEMGLYLRQWKALRQQQGLEERGDGRKRKSALLRTPILIAMLRTRVCSLASSGDDDDAQKEDDDDAQPVLQGAEDDEEHVIDVKRPRLLHDSGTPSLLVLTT
jgi:hypothetical protein